MDAATVRIGLIRRSELTEAQVVEFGRYIATRNADPREHIGYVGTEPDEVAADLRDIKGEHVYAVARTGGLLCGLLCAEWDLDIGRTWLYGPWAESPDLMDRLYTEVRPLVPAGAAEHEMFCDAANTAVVSFAARHGFPRQGQHVIMRFPRERLSALPPERLPPLTPDLHEQFTALHHGAFRGVDAPAAELIARNAPVFVAVDGDTLLGYVVLKLRPEFREAQIRFVAVAEAARGRGTGARLLATALHEAFADDRIPCMDLNTSSPAARRLYERVGFAVLREMRSFRT
jgi:ribosomal protein S18 acetylase RimI-like enzyme